jgi:hypothetical protein
MIAFLVILSLIFLSAAVYFFIPWYKVRNDIRKFKDLYDGDESDMELIYVDTLGNHWYQYKNVLNLPPMRAIRAEIRSIDAEFCLTPQMWDQLYILIKLAFNKGDYMRAGHFIDIVNERRTLPAEEETLKAMCDAYFLLKGENPKNTSEFWYKKKQEAWSKDGDCNAFFLRLAMSMVRDIKEVSKEDFLTFLHRQAESDSLNRALRHDMARS